MKKDSRKKTIVEVVLDTSIACAIATGLNYTILPHYICLLYTSPSPRDVEESRMPSSA